MSETIKLADNFIGIDDRHKLESFGGHTLSLGRATRWHWGKDEKGGDVFEIYRGGGKEILASGIHRNREKDVFFAHDGEGQQIESGTLEHVLAELERYFIRIHHEGPKTRA